MLQNSLSLVCANTVWHHIINVHDNSCAQLQVKLTFYTLLRYCLRYALAVTSLKLASKQIAEPTLQQRNNASQKETPHAPARRPKSYAWSFSDLTRVKAVIYEVFQILCHTHLPHKPILVAVHACQVANVRKYILQGVC